MGVKCTCALYYLLGIMVYLTVEVTSSRYGAGGNGAGFFPLNREKRAGVDIVKDDGKGHIHTVKDDGKGNHQETSSFSSGNGHGSSSSWSSSSSSNSGKGGKSGSVGVGSRSGFSDSGNSQSSKSGRNQSNGGSPGRDSKGSKGSSNDGSREQGLSHGESQGQVWSRGNFQDEDSTDGGFPGNRWSNGDFPGQDWRRFLPRQFGPSFPNQNSLPYYSPSFNFVDPLEQYFRNVQEQQRRFHAFAQNPYQPGGNTWAHAAASMTSPNGGVQPNAKVYTYSWSSTPTRSTEKSNQDSDHYFQQHNQAVKNQQRFSGLNNGIDYGSPFNNYYPNPYNIGSRGDFGNDFGNFDGFNQGFPNSPSDGFSNSFSQPQDGNSAFASISVGPNGGFRQAEVRPGTPGIESRFAEDLPPPSGTQYGVFSSSSSSSQTGPDGKERHQNSAVIGVNDNGKLTYRTIHDP